jgi:hypothetical protein
MALLLFIRASSILNAEFMPDAGISLSNCFLNSLLCVWKQSADFHPRRWLIPPKDGGNSGVIEWSIPWLRAMLTEKRVAATAHGVR